jgi:hypothetical protein
MSYCPKCGNEVNENMVFCIGCGASLKTSSSDQPGQSSPTPAQPVNRSDEGSEKNEKQEKQQHPERGEKHRKGEAGFIVYLIGGLILITVGLFSVLEISGYFNSSDSGQSWAIMLLIIGVIIIVGAIYVFVFARKRAPISS